MVRTTLISYVWLIDLQSLEPWEGYCETRALPQSGVLPLSSSLEGPDS